MSEECDEFPLNVGTWPAPRSRNGTQPDPAETHFLALAPPHSTTGPDQWCLLLSLTHVESQRHPLFHSAAGFRVSPRLSPGRPLTAVLYPAVRAQRRAHSVAADACANRTAFPVDVSAQSSGFCAERGKPASFRRSGLGRQCPTAEAGAAGEGLGGYEVAHWPARSAFQLPPPPPPPFSRH